MDRNSLFALGLLGACLGGCQPDPKETQINAKVRSPDGKLTAIYAEDLSGGPATGVSEDIYIIDGDRFPRIEDRVFSNECMHDIRLAWGTPSTLRIDYAVPRGTHEDTERAGRSLWPWLWHASPAESVRVEFVRHQLGQGGC